MLFEIAPRDLGLAGSDIHLWWWRYDEILILPKDLV